MDHHIPNFGEFNPDLEGYKTGAPSVEAHVIDEDVCRDGVCSNCGHKGLIYEPWNKRGSYRCFAICPECEYREEF